MVLVSYSDSEESDAEPVKVPTKVPTAPASASKPTTTFSVDKSNPRKIRVNLQESVSAGSSEEQITDEPSSKRQRIAGGSAFSGFNSLLPAPKRGGQQPHSNNDKAKSQPRKVFSLKTGAEPGFSRESDTELRQLFSERDNSDATEHGDGTKPVVAPSTSPAQRATPDLGPQGSATKTGNPMLFKPLSVARKPQKRKSAPSAAAGVIPPQTASTPKVADPAPQTKPKVSLFAASSGRDTAPETALAADAQYEPFVYENRGQESDINKSLDTSLESGFDTAADSVANSSGATPAASGLQSLDTIASDLNLDTNARRQLFGRKGDKAGVAVNVVNFNTDKEYAANEALRNSGEQVQHNPVKAPASGKHSLKQLVNMASGQKDALEESFASGKRNKKEAGSKYGW